MSSVFQTLGEITDVYETQEGKQVDLLIPGWDADATTRIPFDKLPTSVQEVVDKEVPVIVLVKVNLSAATVDDLNPTDIELAPSPIDEAELQQN